MERRIVVNVSHYQFEEEMETRLSDAILDLIVNVLEREEDYDAREQSLMVRMIDQYRKHLNE